MINLILMIPLGLLSIFLGWRIWKKEQITLIHDYHYARVAESDKKPYTEEVGKGCIIMGIGIILTGIINLIGNTKYGWICFVIFAVLGFRMMFRAQKKYNGGLF
ncbi:DUF3784 domain-containing protein [Clostridium beijerinckii]|uniref:DUF3784 domain-containing protein n=1 Tax=Clostridium beijerinckii TaxID=1520 RepID=UPI00047C4BF1|nr:DUF3784 domain-containing protein [Clostridium beijerinckii]